MAFTFFFFVCLFFSSGARSGEGFQVPRSFLWKKVGVKRGFFWNLPTLQETGIVPTRDFIAPFWMESLGSIKSWQVEEGRVWSSSLGGLEPQEPPRSWKGSGNAVVSGMH